MTCAHSNCQCDKQEIRLDGKDYCSAVCADAVIMGQDSSGRCPCPHDGCPGN